MDAQRTVARDSIVFQRVLKELSQRHRRQEQPIRVCARNLCVQENTSTVPDVGQYSVPLERLKFLGERHQRSAAAVKDVSVCRTQGPDETWGRVAVLIDQVRQGVEVVEKEVWIDLATEAFELDLKARVLQPRAAQAIAFPIAKQEHRLVDVRDGNHERDDCEERRGQRVLTRARVTGYSAPSP